MGLADLLELGRYLRDRYMDEVKRQMVGLPKELALDIWKLERKEAERLQVGTAAFNAIALTTPEGIAYTLFLALRKADPSFTLDAALALSTPLGEAQDWALVAMGYPPPNHSGAKTATAAPQTTEPK